MAELAKIRRVIAKQLPDAPHETLLTVDATTGQNGLRQAKLFSEAVPVDGIVLTKLDGTAKGGIALAIAGELGIPVKLIGIGEALEDLRPFDADDFAARPARCLTTAPTVRDVSLRYGRLGHLDRSRPCVLAAGEIATPASSSRPFAVGRARWPRIVAAGRRRRRRLGGRLPRRARLRAARLRAARSPAATSACRRRSGPAPPRSSARRRSSSSGSPTTRASASRAARRRGLDRPRLRRGRGHRARRAGTVIEIRGATALVTEI